MSTLVRGGPLLGLVLVHPERAGDDDRVALVQGGLGVLGHPAEHFTDTKQVGPSVHSPVTRSIRRGVQPTRMDSVDRPFLVSEKYGLVATYPATRELRLVGHLLPPSLLAAAGHPGAAARPRLVAARVRCPGSRGRRSRYPAARPCGKPARTRAALWMKQMRTGRRSCQHVAAHRPRPSGRAGLVQPPAAGCHLKLGPEPVELGQLPLGGRDDELRPRRRPSGRRCPRPVARSPGSRPPGRQSRSAWPAATRRRARRPRRRPRPAGTPGR